MLVPVEIAAALFDVSIRYDDVRNAVVVTRGQASTAQAAGKDLQTVFDIYQVDYEYGLNRYSGGSMHNLTVTGAGRLGDGRFTFLSNSSGTATGGFGFRNGTFNLERPNGQRFVAGDLGTGAELQFLSTYLRGASASVPFGNTTVTAFAGRSHSGVLPLSFEEPIETEPLQTEPVTTVRQQFRHDTSVAGAFASTNVSVEGGNRLSFAAGAMRFSGAGRSGVFAAAGAAFDATRFHVQGDVAYGRFTGQLADGTRFTGTGAAVDLTGTFQVSDKLALQARYANISQRFLSPQSGLRQPIELKGAGVTWSPAKWFSTSVNASTARRPGDKTQDNKFAAATVSITPGNSLPSFFIAHTQSQTKQIGSAAFSTFNATKTFSRMRVFLGATRIRTSGRTSLNAQLGANVAINDLNSLEVSQGVGNNRNFNGQLDWRSTRLFGPRVSLTAGIGYNYANGSRFSTFERLSASVVLPRRTSLQVSYYQTNAGPTVLLSLRGSLFRKREAGAYLGAPVSDMNSFGTVSGRVYQDVDQDGRFDPGVDRPQADVKIRVDGNRYVVSDANGMYKFDSVAAGDHKIYLDLLSVRADLTLLGQGAATQALQAGRASVLDFRLVRTGRIAGRVWLDINENGKFDADEQPLADIRVVTASGRDTMTDADGNFTLADLPPGEHVVLLDEKTLPEKVQAGFKPRAVQVLPGSESGAIDLAVIRTPAEIKRFASKPN